MYMCDLCVHIKCLGSTKERKRALFVSLGSVAGVAVSSCLGARVSDTIFVLHGNTTLRVLPLNWACFELIQKNEKWCILIGYHMTFPYMYVLCNQAEPCEPSNPVPQLTA